MGFASDLTRHMHGRRDENCLQFGRHRRGAGDVRRRHEESYVQNVVLPALTAIVKNTAIDARVRKAALKASGRFGVSPENNEDVKSK
jgi:hypothetical protein